MELASAHISTASAAIANLLKAATHNGTVNLCWSPATYEIENAEKNLKNARERKHAIGARLSKCPCGHSFLGQVDIYERIGHAHFLKTFHLKRRERNATAHGSKTN